MGFCSNVQDAESVTVYPDDHVGVVMLILGCLYLLSSFIIIYFIKVQERNALAGNDAASTVVIFPIYVNILWINAIVNVFAGLIAWAYNFQPIDSPRNYSALAFATMWGIQHVVNEGVAVLLMQKGLGVNAAKRALRMASFWGVVTFFLQFGVYVSEPEPSFITSMIWNVSLWVFYLVLWLTPKKRLYRRPAALHYARFWAIFRVFSIAAAILYFADGTYAIGNCMFVFGNLYPYVIFQPIMLYYTLMVDSRWWQGFELESHKRGGNATGEDIRSPLQGVDLNSQSAQSLAASMDTLGIREGLRKGKKPVRLLNFAYISMDSQKMLGCGSFSKVYKGKYRDRPCAIKLIFTLDLTQSVIRRIASEALILSKIRHPNVVEIVGVSVLPPSVCILLELCEYGSLFDVIAGTGPNSLDMESSSYLKAFVLGGQTIANRSSRGLGLSWVDRLYLAMGCARGLNALHRFSTGLCHRDVKSFNFLVDAQLNAKISDLELGTTDEDSEAMTRRRALLNKRKTRRKQTDSRGNSSTQSISDLEAATIYNEEIRADELLANWAAPEVVSDGLHSQPSDIYSLGLVFWELLAGVVPFGDVKRQDEIRQKVLAGERPVIPRMFLHDGADVFGEFILLMDRCWSQEPQQRPTSTQVVTHIESIYKQSCYNILWTTDSMNSVNLSKPSRGFSLFTSRPAAQPIGKEQLAQIWSQLKDERRGEDEGNCLDKFEETGARWLLVANDTSFTVLWASTAWEEQIDVDLHPLLGRSLKQLPIFEAAEGPDAMDANKFFEKMQGITPNHPKHAVLRLRCRLEETTTSARVSAGSKLEGFNGNASGLFALHAFPIVNKTSRLSEEIAIEGGESEVDPPASSLRRLSNSLKSFSGFGSNSATSLVSQSPLEMLPQPSLIASAQPTILSSHSAPSLFRESSSALPIRESRGSVSMMFTSSITSADGADGQVERLSENPSEDTGKVQEQSVDHASTEVLRAPSFVNRKSAEVVMIALYFSKMK